MAALLVSSWFGPRVNPVSGHRGQHQGIDLPAPVGAPVYACRGGVVTRVDLVGDPGAPSANGNAVHVRDALGFRWSYLHLSAAQVRAGEQVQRGSQLGLVGSTGRSTGPHLHLQVADANGKTINPAILFPAGTFYGR